MKFSFLVVLCLVLVGCQKESEVLSVNKIIACYGSKGAQKQKACGELNDAEQQALECLTSKDRSNNCKDISLEGMSFSMERERKPAKQLGTQFDLSKPAQ